MDQVRQQSARREIPVGKELTLSDEKKTRPELNGRKVPVTALADVLMDEAIRDAKKQKKDLSDKAVAQDYTDRVVAGEFGGDLGKAFSKWLKGDASTQQKATWPVTFRTYLVKYFKAGAVPNLTEKKAKLAGLDSAESLQAAVERGAKKAAAKTTAKKTTAKKPAAKKTTAKARA